MSRYFFFAARTLAHRALTAARIRARPAAVIFRLAFGFAEDFPALTLAHLALAAAAIFARPAALIFRFFFGPAGATASVAEPNSWRNFFSSDWIFSFSPAARRNSCGDRLFNDVLIVGKLWFLSTGKVNDGNWKWLCSVASTVSADCALRTSHSTTN
jgi:hypothetical protein